MNFEKKLAGSITDEQKKILVNIEKEVYWIDKKPYSHNIVGLQLTRLNELGFDDEMMKKVIKMFRLDKKGW